jgi:uncharacterized membrane protein
MGLRDTAGSVYNHFYKCIAEHGSHWGMIMPTRKKSKYDVVINLFCLLLLVGIVAILIINWNNIPDKVPGHYNAMGEVDRWGNKGELLILPISGWLLYIGLTVLEHFPQIWNTGVAVTEKNATRIYRILKNMIATIKFLIVCVFVFIAANSAFAKALPGWFLPVFLFLIFGSMIFFIVKLVRAK